KSWPEVMTGLVGVRLAVYDELLTRGMLGVNTLAALVRTKAHATGSGQGGPDELMVAIAWLVQHRLVRADAGQWRAIAPQQARARYEAEGPARHNLEPERGGAPVSAISGSFAACSSGDN